MITKDIFFKRKIFFKEKVPFLRNQFPGQVREINMWYKSNEYDEIQNLKLFFEQKFKALLKIEKEEFVITHQFLYDLYTWCISAEPVCHYCGLPESLLNELHSQPGHINKRWPQRGQSLELDRKQPNLPYSVISNLAFACYWCNNAKTDTFTYDEFREIGKKINKVWETRLNQSFAIPDERK